ERQFERVSGNRVIHTDVRVIAATNRDLPAAIESGTFRTDLFYRLNVFPINVPPLRQRKDDIPMLVEYFVKRYADKARKQIRKIDKNTLKLCQETGKKIGGRPPQVPDPEQAKPEDSAQRNFTDPDSRIMADGAHKGSFVQGFNAQIAVDAKAQIIVAADVTQEANDKQQLAPMFEQVE